MISVTPIYAGLIALLFLVLSFRVVGARRSTKTSVGDGGNEVMLKRMRVQANCAEYAPIGLILLALAELQGMPMVWLHLFGAMLLAGRALRPRVRLCAICWRCAGTTIGQLWRLTAVAISPCPLEQCRTR